MSAQKKDNVILLSPEQIAARRIPIEEAVVTSSKSSNWYCSHCTRHFGSETTFMKHHCEPRRRKEILASPLGQAAYGYYREWLRQKKFSVPSAEAFMESRYYRSFINFAQLIIDASISNPEKYIALMIEADVLPVLWCRDSAYAIYLEWRDKRSDPLDEVHSSINFLFDICEKENAQLASIFEFLGAQRVLSYLRQRRISPWLIFCCPSFGKFMRSLDSSELAAFNSAINSSYWSEKFQSNKKTVDMIKEIVATVQL